MIREHARLVEHFAMSLNNRLRHLQHGTLRKTRDCRRRWLAPKAPIAPGETLTTAPGFPSHTLCP